MNMSRNRSKWIAAWLAVALGVMAPAPEARADQLEQTYWSMISARPDVQSFENYLKRFPDGEHAGEARQRIADLTPAAADATAAPATPAPVNAGHANALLEQAVAAQSRGENQAAMALYGQAADAGSSAAHMHMGNLYERGDGVAPDSGKALEHYQAAGELGELSGYAAGIHLMTANEPSKAADLILAFSRLDRGAAIGVLANVDQTTLIELQQRLANDGFYTSTIDGIAGPGTRSALATYADAGQVQPSPPAAGTGLIVTHSGIGGITSRTAYEAGAFRQALPGYDIEVKQTSAEGMSQMHFIAKKDGREAMRIDGMDGVISSIRIIGEGIADERGFMNGQSTFMDFKGQVERDCTLLEQKDTDEILCQSEDDAISYVFASPAPVGQYADGILHRSSIPRDARLVRIIWYSLD